MDLLLAAFPPELGILLMAPPKGWVPACTGVGPVMAAVATTRLIHEHQPDRVLFMGTCGAYDDRLKVGDLIGVSAVLEMTLSEVQGDAYRPSIQVSRWTADFGPPFSAHTVVATPVITRTLEGARLLSRFGTAEHLELSGVFAACKAYGVPVGAALVVANPVGPEGQEAWALHNVDVSRKLQHALTESGLFD
jgi:nucleoside phosphorylase